MKNTIAVIGGGASGMMAAIAAAEKGAQVTIYEGQDRIGKKILVTGSGRCNLGNKDLSISHYHSSDKALLEQCLLIFGTEESISFFNHLGLLIKEKNGYLYPFSEQAAVVLDVLRIRLSALSVNILTNHQISHVKKEKNNKFTLLNRENKTIGQGFDRVIVTCGGKAAPKTGSDGRGYIIAKELNHSIKKVVPALVPLICEENYCKAIAGVRAEARITVYDGKQKIACESGELQLVEYGISGIPIFQLSGQINYALLKTNKLAAHIDFLPFMEEEDFMRMIQQKKEHIDNRSVEAFFTGMIHKKLIALFLKIAGLKANESIKRVPEKKIKEVYHLCKDFTLHIIGSKSFDNAQVCAGGVMLKEVFPTMESKKQSGLFFAGEILDVDGRCGGYNLQWAWSSGYIAGVNAAGKKDK
ncbi:aminoacetone oxidase family FAD-binding enzyme [Lachnospiraceae bacterium OttesenSCG-928-D06]|nr:aminoacetone oxidase family FAD-binding enzyme [Lachnospiraceae bacterium OttesenSCG-928-D06]